MPEWDKINIDDVLSNAKITWEVVLECHGCGDTITKDDTYGENLNYFDKDSIADEIQDENENWGVSKCKVYCDECSEELKIVKPALLPQPR